MSKRSKILAGLAAAIVLAGLFGYLYLLPRPAKPEKIRLGSFSVAIDYAPYLLAKSKGWFEETFKQYGMGLDYTTFQSLPPINEAFATDRLDIVFEAESPAIIGRAAGIDIRIIGISCSLTQEIIVPATSTIKTNSDLRGKKVAVLAGTSSHYGLVKIASAAGLSKKDFTVIDMRPPDAKSAFETGQVDAWAVWPPWVEQELLEGKGRVLRGGEAQVHSIIAVRGGLIDKHPELVRGALEVIQRAKAWLHANPQEAQQIIAQELKLDIRVVELAWPKHDCGAEITPAVTSDIQAKADFLKEQGLIRASLNVANDLIKPLPASR